MKKALHWFLMIGLAVSMLVNAVLFGAAKTFYTREAQFRLHPTGSPSFEETGIEGLPRVLLLGDSRVAHWKSFATDQYRAINAGVGNETTAQILLRTEVALNEARAEVVVIEAGINDLKVIPLMPDKQKEIVDGCVNNLMAIIRLAGMHGAKAVVLSVLPAGRIEWTRSFVWSPAVDQSVQTVNRVLAEKCGGDPSVRFVDLSSEPKIGRDYLDTLHFSDAFYRRIAPQVERAIEAVRNPQRDL